MRHHNNNTITSIRLLLKRLDSEKENSAALRYSRDDDDDTQSARVKKKQFLNWCVHQLKRWRTNLQLSISSIDPSAFRLVSFVIFAPSEATQSTKVTWTSFIVSSLLFSVVVSSFDDARRTLVDVFFRWYCVCTRRDRWWWWCFDWTMKFKAFRCCWCSRRRGWRKTLFWWVEKEDDEDIIVLTKVGVGRRVIERV